MSLESNFIHKGARIVTALTQLSSFGGVVSQVDLNQAFLKTGPPIVSDSNIDLFRFHKQQNYGCDEASNSCIVPDDVGNAKTIFFQEPPGQIIFTTPIGGFNLRNFCSELEVQVEHPNERVCGVTAIPERSQAGFGMLPTSATFSETQDGLVLFENAYSNPDGVLGQSDLALSKTEIAGVLAKVVSGKSENLLQPSPADEFQPLPGLGPLIIIEPKIVPSQSEVQNGESGNGDVQFCQIWGFPTNKDEKIKVGENTFAEDQTLSAFLNAAGEGAEVTTEHINLNNETGGQTEEIVVKSPDIQDKNEFVAELAENFATDVQALLKAASDIEDCKVTEPDQSEDVFPGELPEMPSVQITPPPVSIEFSGKKTGDISPRMVGYLAAGALILLGGLGLRSLRKRRRGE